MKLIKAVIQPFMLHPVLDALHLQEGLPGVAIENLRCINLETGSNEEVIRTQMEMMVPDHLVDVVVGIIQEHAHTGQPGDGRIFVIPIEQTVHIRTGVREDAGG